MLFGTGLGVPFAANRKLGIAGKLFGAVRGVGGFAGGLTNSLSGSVSAGAMFVGALSLQVALAGNVNASPVFGGNLTATAPSTVSFDLPFSTMSAGSDLTAKGVTFTRSGNAMQYDSTGKLTYAPNNMAIQSNAFTTSPWTLNGATLTANQTTDPFGGNNGWKIANSGAGNLYINEGFTSAVLISFYLKAGTNSTVYMFTNAGDVISFDLSAGTASTSGPVVSIVSAGSGWYRCSAKFPSGTAYWGVSVTAGYAYVYGAQYEAVTYQTTPRPYIPTTTAAVYGPRFDYDPATLAAKGLLIEESRTNQFAYSQDLTNAAWTLANAVVTLAGGLAPDGVTSFSTITESAVSGYHRIYQLITTTPGSLCSFSAYFKAGTRRYVVMSLNNGGNNSFAVIDTQLWTITGYSIGASTTPTVSIVSVGGGIYKAMLTGSLTGGFTDYYCVVSGSNVSNPAGDSPMYLAAGETIILTGLQAEIGAFATSYIPTTSASVTRAEEDCSITGSAFSSFYNQSEGSWFADVYTAPGFVKGNGTIIEVSETSRGSNGVYQLIHGTTGTSLNFFNPSFVGGVFLSLANTSPTKIAFGYKSNDSAVSQDGGAVQTDTVYTFTGGMAKLGIGKPVDSNEHIGQAWFKTLQYYNTRKTNVGLQALTAPSVALDLSFYTMSAGSDLAAKGVTFTRSGNAMQYDSTGKLTWAPNNLFAYSAAPDNAVWQMGTGASTSGSVITLAADENSRIKQAISGDGSFILSVKFSAADVGKKVRLGIASSTLVEYGSGRSSDLTIPSDGLVYYKWDNVSGLTYGSVTNSSVGASQTLTLDASRGLQLEAVTYQTTPRAYIPTTSAAAYGPRFDYDPVTHAAKGLLIEESRTNIVVGSNEFANGLWNDLQASVAKNVTGPDGVSNGAWTLTSSGGTEYTNYRQSLADAANQTYSIYAKAGTVGYAYLTSLAGHWAVFNLTTGAVFAVSSATAIASMTSVGNGWYRCALTTTDAITSATFVIGMKETPSGSADPWGNGTTSSGSNIQIFGAQREAGAFATSYIPTTSASVTRAAETAQMTGTNFSSWYNQSEGTFYTEAAPIKAGAYSTIAATLNAANTGFADLVYIGNGTPFGYRSTSSASSGSVSDGVAVKIATAYTGSTEIAISVNGAAVATAAASVPPTAATLSLGARDGGLDKFNGHVKSLQYYSIRKSNSELVSLTT